MTVLKEKVELEQQLQVLEKQLLKRKIESTQLELQHLVKSTSPKKVSFLMPQ